MSLMYRVIQRFNPRKPNDPRKYYAQVITRGEINLRELADEIADISTVSTVDTIAVIESLIQLIPRHITKGEIVRIGDFGSLSCGILSNGVDSENAPPASGRLHPQIQYVGAPCSGLYAVGSLSRACRVVYGYVVAVNGFV